VARTGRRTWSARAGERARADGRLSAAGGPEPVAPEPGASEPVALEPGAPIPPRSGPEAPPIPRSRSRPAARRASPSW
jgi:hypothetical protein